MIRRIPQFPAPYRACLAAHRGSHLCSLESFPALWERFVVGAPLSHFVKFYSLSREEQPKNSPRPAQRSTTAHEEEDQVQITSPVIIWRLCFETDPLDVSLHSVSSPATEDLLDALDVARSSQYERRDLRAIEFETRGGRTLRLKRQENRSMIPVFCPRVFERCAVETRWVP